jgi:hypothetical protein
MQEVEKLRTITKDDCKRKLNLLSKTNKFFVILALRYGLVNQQVLTDRDINISYRNHRTTPKIVTFRFIILVDYKKQLKMNTVQRTDITNMCKMVGRIREYVIRELEGTKHTTASYAIMFDDILLELNKKYKEYIKDMWKENLLGDFLTSDEVHDIIQKTVLDVGENGVIETK